jgi:hypothetical protein
LPFHTPCWQSQAMAVLIHTYRISLIWVDVELRQASGAGRLSKLRRRAGYEATVDALRKTDGHDADLRLPWWRKVPPHFFWLYYFGRLLPDKIDGVRAWRELAPLQLASPVAQVAMPAQVAGEIRGYIAPQVIAVMADVKGKAAALELNAWVEQCRAIRTGPMTVGLQGRTVSGMRLQDAAIEVLARLRQELGLGSAQRALAEPFTVVTVLQGEGVRADRSPTQQTWRCAHAVSAWPARWRQVQPDLSRAIPLRRRDVTKGDLLYGSTHGRAAWMPSRFLPSDWGPVNTMGCFHHNLALAGMQVEMLLDFVRALDGADDPSRADWSAAGHRAAGLLGRLYGGAEDMYRSASVSRHIADSGLAKSIDALRQLYSMQKLALAI